MTKREQDPPYVLKRAPNWVSGLRPTEQEGINPKDKFGSTKVPLHLVPATSTILQAICMDDGGIKYGPYNYRVEPIQAIGYLSAAKRHIDAALDGQDYDTVTGKPHVGYALSTLGIYADAWFNGTLIDNRPVPGVGGVMIDMLSTTPGADPRSPEDFRKIFEAIQRAGKQQSTRRLAHAKR